ncbi:MAG: AMP-binding protein, partial [bacterium]
MIRLGDFEGRPYPEARLAFRWQIPSHYNIGLDVCDRWAAHDPSRVAIVHESETGARGSYTYGALRDASNRLANALGAYGIRRGDRVAIILHQRMETAAAHIAVYKLG